MCARRLLRRLSRPQPARRTRGSACVRGCSASRWRAVALGTRASLTTVQPDVAGTARTRGGRRVTRFHPEEAPMASPFAARPPAASLRRGIVPGAPPRGSRNPCLRPLRPRTVDRAGTSSVPAGRARRTSPPSSGWSIPARSRGRAAAHATARLPEERLLRAVESRRLPPGASAGSRFPFPRVLKHYAPAVDRAFARATAAGRAVLPAALVGRRLTGRGTRGSRPSGAASSSSEAAHPGPRSGRRSPSRAGRLRRSARNPRDRP